MWVILADRPTTTLVVQHVQIVVGIHDPRHWPGAMWKRKQRQRAEASERNRRERAGRGLPRTCVEEGESTRDLIPSHQSEA